MPSHSETSVAVQNLTLRLGAKVVLAGLTFEVPAGQVVAIAGENGAGKSTLLRLLAGVYMQTSGSLRVGHEISDVGALLGDPVFLDWMSPRNFVRMLVESSGKSISAANTEEELAYCGLDRRLSRRRISRLSQGQRQRLALTIAFLGRPSLLLLDEPFSHLDHDGIVMLENRIVDARCSGTTVVLTSHRRSEAELADRVIVLDGGRVVADGELSCDFISSNLR